MHDAYRDALSADAAFAAALVAQFGESKAADKRYTGKKEFNRDTLAAYDAKVRADSLMWRGR